MALYNRAPANAPPSSLPLNRSITLLDSKRVVHIRRLATFDDYGGATISPTMSTINARVFPGMMKDSDIQVIEPAGLYDKKVMQFFTLEEIIPANERGPGDYIQMDGVLYLIFSADRWSQWGSTFTASKGLAQDVGAQSALGEFVVFNTVGTHTYEWQWSAKFADLTMYSPSDGQAVSLTNGSITASKNTAGTEARSLTGFKLGDMVTIVISKADAFAALRPDFGL